MLTGKIKNLFPRGFGFIESKDHADTWFHASAVVGNYCFETLSIGQRVNFEVTQGAKGPMAAVVRVID